MSQVLPSVGRSRACLFLLTFLNCSLISTPVLFIWTCQLDYYSGSLGLPLSCIFNSLRISYWGLSTGCTGRAVKAPTYLELSLMTAILRHPC